MAGNPSERRRAPRARADFPIRLGSHPAQLKDISEGGLACQVKEPIEEMTRVQIDLELPSPKGRRKAAIHSVEGAVVYCAPIEDGSGAEGHDLGILFLAPPREAVESIREFVQHQVAAEQGEG